MGEKIKRPSLLTKLWSYISEVHIESSSNDIHDHVYVSYVKGRYQLTAGNAIYSYEDLYGNFFSIFNKVDFSKVKAQNVLVLGTGLGSIPQMLEQNFKQDYNYTCIDIDEDILYFFSKYVQPELNSSIEQICADASIFLKVNDQQFDMIIVDVFIGCETPKMFDTIYFLEDIQKNLTKDGIVIINKVANTTESKKASEKYFEETFVSKFNNAISLHTGGNLMLINNKSILKN